MHGLEMIGDHQRGHLHLHQHASALVKPYQAGSQGDAGMLGRAAVERASCLAKELKAVGEQQRDALGLGEEHETKTSARGPHYAALGMKASPQEYQACWWDWH